MDRAYELKRILGECNNINVICLTASSGYSGAEQQCLEFVKYCTFCGFKVKLISLPKFLADIYHWDSRLVKAIVLAAFSLRLLLVGRKRLVVLWGLPAMISFYPAKIFCGNISTICTERQYSPAVYRRLSLYQLYANSVWFFNSRYVRDAFVGNGLSELSRSFVFYNIRTDLSHFKNIPMNVPKNDFDSGVKMVWVGRINAAKEVERCIAFLSCRRVGRLYIFGVIEDQKYYEKLVLKFRSAGISLLYQGYQHRKNIFSQNVILVNTSLQEGFPNSVIDAVVMGSVVYSVRVPYLEEIGFPDYCYFDSYSEKVDWLSWVQFRIEIIRRFVL